MTQESLESPSISENPYEEVDMLKDFWQKIATVTVPLGSMNVQNIIDLPFERIREQLDKELLPNISEEHFIEGWSDVIKQHPQKVARINQCIELINKSENTATFGKAVNEIWRLLLGKEKRLPLEGEEYNPDHLNL